MFPGNYEIGLRKLKKLEMNQNQKKARGKKKITRNERILHNYTKSVKLRIHRNQLRETIGKPMVFATWKHIILTGFAEYWKILKS